MSDPQKTILLVEDEFFIAVNEAKTLQQEGYAVILAYTGKQAIEIVKANPAAINLILMDINLGRGLDGSETARIILQAYDIPTVFLSAYTDPETLAKIDQLTSYGYVVKGTGSAVLLASLKIAFKLHAARQTIHQTNDSLRREIAERQYTETALRNSEERFRRIFEDGPLGMAIVGADFHFIQANTSFCQMVGYPEPELTLLTFKDITHPAHLDRDMGQLLRLLNEEIPLYQTEKRYCRKDGGVIWGAATISIVRDENGEFLHCLAMIEDITERKQAEEALKTSEERFRVAQELSLDAFTILHSVRDEQGQITDFEWAYVNPAAGRILKQLPAQLVGRRLLKILPGNKENKALFDRYVRIVESDQGDEVELRYDADGLTGWFRNVTVKLDDGVAVSFSDITARKQMEEALRESEERFRFVLSNSLDAAYRRNLQTDQYDYLSPVIEQLTGWSVAEMNRMDTQTVLALMHPDDIPRVMEEIERTYALCQTTRQGAAGQLEYRLRAKPGEYRWLGDVFNVVSDAATGRPLYRLGIVRDITERKRMEEALRHSEARFRAFMDNSPAIAWAKDEQGRHIYLSRTYEERFSVNFADWRGKTDFELWPPEVAQSFWQNDQLVLTSNQPIQVEEETTNPDGSRCRWLNYKFPFYDPDGQKCVGGIGIDITERKQMEEALHLALAEKEMLMSELQHRVKNSFTKAISLLELEYHHLSDDRARAVFAGTQARLRTISTLYDQLNQSQRVDRLDLRQYLQILVDKLAQAYLPAAGPVAIETHLAALEWDTKRATPLGLIVNELVTNALKYAFPMGRVGVIRVELAQAAEVVTLTVADNGIGLTASRTGKRENSSGLGLNLVEMLTRQLDGTLTVEDGPGVTVRVSFKK